MKYEFHVGDYVEDNLKMASAMLLGLTPMKSSRT